MSGEEGATCPTCGWPTLNLAHGPGPDIAERIRELEEKLQRAMVEEAKAFCAICYTGSPCDKHQK